MHGLEKTFGPEEKIEKVGGTVKDILFGYGHGQKTRDGLSIMDYGGKLNNRKI
jgi:hypothetical protein